MPYQDDAGITGPDVEGIKMPTFIVTGTYSQEAARGMIANPSDREAATRALIEAGGGTLISFYATTGPTDFHIVAEAPDAESVLSCVMAAGASGATGNLQTIRAFSSAELMAIKKRAANVAAAYTAPQS